VTLGHREWRRLFPEFQAESWAGWNCVDDLLNGLAPDDPELARVLTARTMLPSTPVAELWAIAGRGGGKSRFAGRTLVYRATSRTYRRAPGELIYHAASAPDRRQSNILLGYCRGLFRSVPMLERMIIRETSDTIELSNGNVIEVITASMTAPRGRSYATFVIDEAACHSPCV